MEPYDQSSGESFPLNNTYNIEVPFYVTYLNMVIIPVMATVVITPSVMVINVIGWTKELHTRYYYFIASLLGTDIVSITVRSISQCVIMILYLLGSNSDSAQVVLQASIFPLFTLIHLITIMLPITIAIERMIVIGYPYRHRSILTTRTVFGILAAVLGVSVTLTAMITIVVSVDVVWPLGLVYYDATVAPFVVFPRLTSAIFIIVANSFLFYKVYESNRKAKENERLGNEEEAKKFEKLIQLLRMQMKPTITLLLVGGIDVIGNVLISFMYTTIKVSTEPNTTFYLEQFLMYPISVSLLLCHPLVYGVYMKKIRGRLPRCVSCQNLCNAQRSSRVVRLHQRH